MFDNYLAYDGVEIANAARTNTYAAALGLSWFRGEHDVAGLEEALNTTYSTPSADGAPWIDSDFPESANFAGFHVLGMSKILDSTTTRTVTPLIQGGGHVGPGIAGPREIVIRGVLIGSTRESVLLGLGWLRSTLANGAICGEAGTIPGYGFGHGAFGHGDFGHGDESVERTEFCYGFEMALLAKKPEGDESIEQMKALYRMLYNVNLTTGPDVLNEKDIRDCGSYIEVEFTLTAANPIPYTLEYPVSALDDTTSYLWLQYEDGSDLMSTQRTYADVRDLSGVDNTYGEVLTYLFNMGSLTPPDPIAADVVGPAPDPFDLPASLLDPSCSAPVMPPLAPQTLELGCHDFWTGSWERRTFQLPATSAPNFSTVVPRITLRAGAEDHPDLRIRFAPQGTVPDDFTYEFYVTWLPAGGLLEIDAIRDRLTLTSEGVRIDASHLVVSNRTGSAFKWPVLTCGGGWNIAIDTPDGQTALDVEVEASFAIAGI